MTDQPSERGADGRALSIGEAAGELGLPQHVLRFWETKFADIRPLKRAGGRRAYRPEDVALLRAIQALLYAEGYTIKGVQGLFAEVGAERVVEGFQRAAAAAPRAPAGRGALEPPAAEALPSVRRAAQPEPRAELPAARGPAMPPEDGLSRPDGHARTVLLHISRLLNECDDLLSSVIPPAER